MTHLLSRALDPVVQRRRRFRFVRETAWIAGLLCLIGLAALFLALPPADAGRAAGGLLAGAAALVALAHWRHARWNPDYRQIARAIEQRHPELHSLLVTAVEQAPETHTGELNFLQQRVVQSAIAESRKHSWLDEIPAPRRFGARALQVLLFLGLFAVVAQLTRQALPIFSKPSAPIAAVEPLVKVTPGDAELERGSGLIVTAEFERQVPSAATLIIQPRNGQAQTHRAHAQSERPGLRRRPPRGRPAISPIAWNTPASATRDFQVKVFEHPRLDRADATLRPPEYTKLPVKELPETRRLSGVEGSKLDVAFQLNKPVTSAWLQSKDGAVVPLAVDSAKPVADLKDHALRASQAYELHLVDADGRANKVPESFVVDVLPNRRPELKRKLPRGDQRVSPLQELAFHADAWDDFGLLTWGLSLTLPNGEAKEIVFGKETQADQRVEGKHLLQLEPLGVEPDELVSWHLWAEDIGPDGKPRRTAGDIFFAEVRPFEEIFRQGEEGDAPPGSAAGQQAQKLAELQKQIISATWNLQRREQGVTEPSPAYRKDEPVIRESQTAAVAQAEEMRRKWSSRSRRRSWTE